MEAKYYRKMHSMVLCELCPNRCGIMPGKTGICRSRRNDGGTLVADGWMRAAAACVDPVEKKPLYHYMPGTRVYSLGPNGCSLTCAFCQNSRISQEESPTFLVNPTCVVKSAEGTTGVAYTYAEPSTWIETVLALAEAVRKAGLANILVTNGYVEKEPAKALLDAVDAVNVDLKGFTDKYYWEVCRGHLEPVLDFIKMAHWAGKHVEISFPLVEGQNDKDTPKLANWIAKELHAGVPLHILRCFPHWRWSKTTSEKAVEKAYEQARKRLSFVYTPDHRDTVCPRCGKVMVTRDMGSVVVHRSRCCGYELIRKQEAE